LGLTALRAVLARHRLIALDTSVFVYYLEANPSYVDPAGEVFAWLERSPNAAVTSTLTMTELLVHPYRASNDRLVNQYYGLLSVFPNLEWGRAGPRDCRYCRPNPPRTSGPSYARRAASRDRNPSRRISHTDE
jgi:hypothetical protein